METQSRLQKYSYFDDFFKKSKSIFEEISSRDKKTKVFNDHYNLCICPGGWAGGLDKTRVEIFYGNRPIYSTREYINGNFLEHPKEKIISEHGACLSYIRTATGAVICMLEPARTEGVIPQESIISLRIIKNPKILLKDSLPKKHWKYFIRYMRCTSVDGSPSWLDKLAIFWLRSTSTLIIDGKETPPRIWKLASETLKLSLTVGFSGFMLFALSQCSKSPQSVFIEGASSAVLTDANEIKYSINKLHLEVLEQTKRIDKLANEISSMKNDIHLLKHDSQKIK